MKGTVDTEKLFEELAYRESDGIEVSLLWSKVNDRLTVFVADTKTGEAFELGVEKQDALEVFRHPYAYAAFQGRR